MKKFIPLFSIMFIFVIAPRHSFAQSSGFGLGIIIGEPTGLSAKMWTSSSTAFDAGLAWSFGNKGNLHVHADYLWHNFDVFSNKQLPLYYGLGGRVDLGDDVGLGIRGVIGINYLFSDIPLDAFLELVPVFDVTPGTGFGFNGGIGLRYFF